MKDQFEKEARELAFHLSEVAKDLKSDDMKQTASDLVQASLTIKILLQQLNLKG